MRAFLTIVIVVAIILLGYYLIRRSQEEIVLSPTVTTATPTPTGTVTATPVPTAIQSASITLGEQNDSGESGTMALTALSGNRTQVVLTLTGAPTTAQPAHIHTGSCANLGGIKYNLTNVVNGTSTTTINVALNTLLTTQLPLAVNVHKSASEINTYVACGDLTI